MTSDQTNCCENLEEYVAGDLSDQQLTIFEVHLSKCESCRHEVAEWQRLRETLQSAARELEIPSDRLLRILDDDATVSVIRKRRPATIQAATIATCLGLLLAVFVASLKQPPHVSEEPQIPLPAFSKSVTVMPAPDVEFEDDIIGVPIEIDDPNVTVVWLYPTENPGHSTF